MTDLEKAIRMYEEQDSRELDFCYEGGHKDAIFCAKVFYQELIQ